jgi:hypothetical protein
LAHECWPDGFLMSPFPMPKAIFIPILVCTHYVVSP